MLGPRLSPHSLSDSPEVSTIRVTSSQPLLQEVTRAIHIYYTILANANMSVSHLVIPLHSPFSSGWSLKSYLSCQPRPSSPLFPYFSRLLCGGKLAWLRKRCLGWGRQGLWVSQLLCPAWDNCPRATLCLGRLCFSWLEVSGAAFEPELQF